MDGLIASPGPRFGPESAFALPGIDQPLRQSDHSTLDRAWDIGNQSEGVLYDPQHGKPLTTAAFVGAAVDGDHDTTPTSYSKGFRYNKDQRDFYVGLRIFYWFKERDQGIGSQDQTNFDLDQIKDALHDAYPNKDRIKSYAFGMIKGVQGWDPGNDEERIGRAVVRHKLYNEGIPNDLDSNDKQVRYFLNNSVWDDYQKIFGSNAPMIRCQTDQKEWDINFEGVAHYGLLPDFLQDLSNVGLEPRDLSVMFQSAEHFAQMWTKTLNAADAINHPELHVALNLDPGLVLNLEWFAQSGDQIQESDQLGTSGNWHLAAGDIHIENGHGTATIPLGTSGHAHFYRVLKP
jgi:hypothetical protein